MYIVSTLGRAGVWRPEAMKGKGLRVECWSEGRVFGDEEERTRKTRSRWVRPRA